MIPDITQHNFPVGIVGGGPVGLFLALCLTRAGIRCKVLEQRATINPHSKSVGIHPVSLELFDREGISEPFLEAGIKIRKGHAFTDQTRVGTISFDGCPPPHTYVLALPQNRTEQILEEQLREADPECLTRSASVTGIELDEDQVRVNFVHNDIPQTLSAGILVGCDGKSSLVREASNIPIKGTSYPDTYIMGDFTDNTSFGPDAAIYLHRDGLIESFPLPDGMRRWVAKTDAYRESVGRSLIEEIIYERIHHSLSETQNTMLSSFGVQHLLADTFVRGRTFLAGDAAHVVSPIGGQGMNLGFLDVADFTDTLVEAIHQPENSDTHFRAWSRRRRKIARKAARRAELNMWLGRKRRYPFIRNTLIRLITNTPLRKKMAKTFTMRDIVG